MQKCVMISMLSMLTQGPLCHSQMQGLVGSTHSIRRLSRWLPEPQMDTVHQLLGLRLLDCELTTVKAERYVANLTVLHN